MVLMSWLGSKREELPKAPPVQRSIAGLLFDVDTYGKAIKQVRKDQIKNYQSQRKDFLKGKAKRIENFEKKLAYDKREYFRKAGNVELAMRPPTEAELADPYMKRRVKEFELKEYHMRKDFKDSERDSDVELRSNFHEGIREGISNVRKYGPEAYLSKSQGRQGLLRHLIGGGDPRGGKSTNSRL